MSATIPAAMENHLDAIQCWKDGKVVLGSSNLTGRYWNGSLWCFQNVEDAPDIEKCLTGMGTESGICDILCLMDNKVVIGLDSGAVEMYQLESDPVLFGSVFYSCEHDDAVCSLSINSSQSKLVSCSYDKCIKVWDLHSWVSTSTYRPAHTGIVWQVSCSTTEPQVFISCSQDGKVMLWDLRLPKPATVLNKEPLKSVPMSVAWQPQSPTTFAVGGDNGQIVVKDIRGTGGSLWEFQAHSRGVYRLIFCPTCPSWLASCADSTDIRVTDVGKDKPFTIYEDDSHMDFVRGLSWSPDSGLISSGWDKKVKKHVISTYEMDVASPNGS